ncbi:MAG: hypothetical protein QOE70_515 [Chthoniobacter sp.]|nr:hypothetical protein [Chthoniobacter sp.]
MELFGRSGAELLSLFSSDGFGAAANQVGSQAQLLARDAALFDDVSDKLAITDPETGLTFGYLRYTETSSHRIFVTVECLYGFKVAIPAGLNRIVKP